MKQADPLMGIIIGDSLAELKKLSDESVQCCVTSPPFWGLRAYGTKPQIWDGRPDCEHIWEKTASRREQKESDVKNSKSKQATNSGANIDLLKTDFCRLCNAWCGEYGLEPTPELYVQHTVEIFREVRRVLRKGGTLFLNLGDSYAGSGKAGANPEYQKRHTQFGQVERKERLGVPIGAGSIGLKPKDLIGIPWRVAFALQKDGWWLRQDIIWSKPNPMPESVTDRCTKAHEYIFLLTKSSKYYYDADAIAEPTVTRDNITRDRDNTRLNNVPGRSRMAGLVTNDYESRNKRSVWTINTQPYPEAHFAVFPDEIPANCIKAGSKEGDVVLDPFLGSGTTAQVAKKLGRKYIGIELNPEYLPLINRRLAQEELFNIKVNILSAGR